MGNDSAKAREVRFGEAPDVRFGFGVFTSLLLHLILIIIGIVALERSAATALEMNQVFSVTIEGGMSLGGISQAPKEGGKKILTPEKNQDKAPEPEKKAPAEEKKEPEPQKKAPPPEEKPEKQLTEPSVVDDPAKRLLEKKKEEEKRKEEQKKLDEKKRKEKEKEDEKKKEEQEKKAKEKEREARDKKLQDAIKRVQNQYEGESADARGKGFGAATLGGKGMGGGTITSLEKFAYQNALKEHVKGGWHWLGGSEHLKADVRVKIQPNGQISDVHIEASSGNRSFDDSVVRAVYKASPVPPPPPQLYEEFKDVVFNFDSKE